MTCILGLSFLLFLKYFFPIVLNLVKATIKYSTNNVVDSLSMTNFVSLTNFHKIETYFTNVVDLSFCINIASYYMVRYVYSKNYQHVYMFNFINNNILLNLVDSTSNIKIVLLNSILKRTTY